MRTLFNTSGPVTASFPSAARQSPLQAAVFRQSRQRNSYTLDTKAQTAHRRSIAVESRSASEATAPAASSSQTRKLDNGVIRLTESLRTKKGQWHPHFRNSSHSHVSALHVNRKRQNHVLGNRIVGPAAIMSDTADADVRRARVQLDLYL